MSMTWGPAVDAEINYRRQQARRDFGRSIFHRKARSSGIRRRAIRSIGPRSSPPVTGRRQSEAGTVGACCHYG